jgi:hypothetical protein
MADDFLKKLFERLKKPLTKEIEISREKKQQPTGNLQNYPFIDYWGILGKETGGLTTVPFISSSVTPKTKPTPTIKQTLTEQKQPTTQIKETTQVGQPTQTTPAQPTQTTKPQTTSDVIKNIITMSQSVQSRTIPTQTPELSAASLGKLVEPEKKELDEMFQKYLDEFRQLNQLTQGMLERMTGISEAEIEARKAAIMRQYEEQKQALQEREREALERIQEGREALGLRNIIIGKYLEQIEREEARVSSEFAKAYAMLDMMKEEALTQALATQREEDWNRLAQILNTRLNLFNQHMNIWQAYQQNKLALRQQALSELVTQAQLRQSLKQDALNDLEILLRPYAGTGMSYESVPLSIRKKIEDLEVKSNLPLTDIARQLVSIPNVGIVRSGNNVFIYNKATGQPIQTISMGAGELEGFLGTSQVRKMNLNQYIDSIIRTTLYGGRDPITGEEIPGWIREKGGMFTASGKLKNPKYLENLIESIALTTGLDRDDILSRANPDLYVDLDYINNLADERLKSIYLQAYQRLKENHLKAARLVLAKQSPLVDALGLLSLFATQLQSTEQIK